MIRKSFFILMITLTLNSCGILESPTDLTLDDGHFHQRVDGESRKVYVHVQDEAVRIYPMEGKTVDTTGPHQSYSREIPDELIKDIRPLYEHKLDIDFMTILAKYRPPREGVPAQLSADFNGALYLGYRVDRHKLTYKTDPMGTAKIGSTQFGFSFGGFTGIGNTFMSPFTTHEHVDIEYDGIVWQNGIAGIIAINRFTVGAALGFDTLLDDNRRFWIYHDKPWLGLVLGINLN